MKSRLHYLRITALALLGFGVFLFPQSSSATDNTVAPVAIKIDNFSFSPQTITIPAGTGDMNWDDIPHTVVSDDKSNFQIAGARYRRKKFTFTFTKPGTYGYFCSIHPKMTAKIIVQ